MSGAADEGHSQVPLTVAPPDLGPAVASPSTSTPTPTKRDRRRAPSASGPGVGMNAPSLLRSLSGLSQSPAGQQGNERHVAYSLARMASHETAEIGLGGDEEEEEDPLTHGPSTGAAQAHGTSAAEALEEAAEGVTEAAVGKGVAPDARADDDSERTFIDGGKAESGHAADQPANDKDGKSKATEIMDQTNLLPIRQVIVVFAGLSAALFCCLLDQTIVSTALPTLGRVFGRADISSWVGTAYLLTSTACQPMYGRFSDIFGRKVVLLVSLAIFLAGSLACAVAQSMIQLIVFRALAGIGGGGILTLVMIIVSDVVSLRERGKYQGILGGVVALSNSIGPILGGVFTEKASWRWCFYINLPLTALSMLVVIFLLPLKRVKGNVREKLKKLDYYGSALTLAWAVLILLPISWGGTQYGWGSAAVIAPLVIGVALLFVFLFVEWKLVPLPIVPLTIFNDRTVNGAMAATFLSGIVFYCQLYFLPQFFQVVYKGGVSAIRSGVLLLPLILVQTVTSFTSGLIVSKTGDYRINLILGFFIWTIASGLLSTINENTTLAQQVGYQILSGFGAGQTFQTSLVAIQATVDRKSMAVATGTRNMLRLLGGTVGLAISSAILNNTVRSRLQQEGLLQASIDAIIADPTTINSLAISAVDKEDAIKAYVKGIQSIYYFLIPCCGLSLILVVLFVKAHSLKRDDDDAMKAQGKEWAEKRAHKHGHGHLSKHASPTSSRKASVVDALDVHEKPPPA